MSALTPVILTIHTLVVLALVGVVLLQRSEGGALGMGGGGGGGMMSGRGAANVLTRTTTMLAAAFFFTSVVLAITSDRGETERELLERTTGESIGGGDDPSVIDLDDILDPGSDAPEGGEAATGDPLVIPDPAAGVIPDPTDTPPASGDGDDDEPQR